MRLLELALVGALALTAPIVVQAEPLGSTTRPGVVGPAPGVVKVWDSNRLGWHPMSTGWAGDWRRAPVPSRQWNGGWVSRRWWPCCTGPGVTNYWVWGPSGGTFDYPFSDWRGPTGGWGNP